MDKFYRYLRKDPLRKVYYWHDNALNMLTIGTDMVIACFREMSFKPDSGWVKDLLIAKYFDEAMRNAERAEIVEVIGDYKITLVAGESKAVAVSSKYLRLFDKKNYYQASVAGGIPAAVVTFKQGIAVIAGHTVWRDGEFTALGHDLARAKKMIERVLNTQTRNQKGATAL